MCLITGTHYLRSRNNRYQPWCNWRTRKDLKMRALNPTEEGLASLHSVIFRDDPSLWRSAFLYYTIWKASQVSFCELFKDLGLYVDDPNVRWDYCVRAKRGLIDTSQPGECTPSIHSEQYRGGGLLLPCNPRRALQGFSWGLHGNSTQGFFLKNLTIG